MTRNYFCQEENVRFFDRSTCTFNFIGTLTLLLVVLFISPVICFGADSTTVTAGLSGVTAVNPTAGVDSNRFGGGFTTSSYYIYQSLQNLCERWWERCIIANPYTGGCSCPGGYGAYLLTTQEVSSGVGYYLVPTEATCMCVR